MKNSRKSCNRDGLRAAYLVLTVALLVAAAGCGSSTGGQKPWQSMEFPVLNEIQLPDYERVEMPNGMIVYLVEDHEFPLVELSATIEVGAIYEDADKVGLAEMTGSVIRSGGTATHSGDDLDEMVEARGMGLNVWVGQTDGGAYLSTMKEDAQLGLDLLADILRNPVFPEEKIKLAKEEQKAAIARRNDDPMSIAQREGMKAVFGEDHPMARHAEYATIAAVTRQDMIDFHAEWFHPDRMYLVVIGDFDSAEMKDMIGRAFDGWERAASELPADPEIPELPRTVNIADKDDLTQTTVLMGHKGIRADDPNYAAIQVANRILGGGFATRLFNEVRSRQGLAYSVGSSAGTGFRYPGLFMAFTMTKSGSSEHAVDAILTEIGKMTQEPVTEAELASAKDGILNSEVFNYDSKREIMDRLVMFERYGYPADFLDTYQAAVKSMTVEEILAACQAVWHPEQMTIFAVGNYADFDGDFSKFGPVTMVDITIPEPALDIPEATAETLAEGKALMEKAAQAAGGDAFAKLKGYFSSKVMSATIQGMAMQFTIEETVSYPDRVYTLQKTQWGNMESAVDGETGWSKSMMGEQDLEPAQAKEALNGLKTSYIGMFRNLDELQCQALEPKQIEGVDCLPVHVSGIGDDYSLVFLRADDLRIFMIQSPGMSPMTQAPVTQKLYHDEYAEQAGMLLPAKSRLLYDDELFAEIESGDFEANPKVDDALFQK